MNVRLVVALGAAAAVAVILCRSPRSAAAEPSNSGVQGRDERSESGTRYVVAAIGDSLTDFAANGGLYLRYLRERCPESRFDGYGKGGEMVNQMRRRFVRDLFGSGAPVGYTHVIVFGGVNDLYSDITAKRTVAKIESDLSTMYASAREHGAKVVAVTVTPWGGFTRYFNDSRARTTEELNRWILSENQRGATDYAVDANPLLSCGDRYRLCERYAAPFKDGLHFGPEGHKRLADALSETVFRRCR
jgi:lysophospholipase L1-like esterase